MELKIDQGSGVWFIKRAPRFTNSNIFTLIGKDKTKLTQGALTYVYDKAAVALYSKHLFEDENSYTSESMQRGNDLEPVARMEHSIKTGVNFRECGFFLHSVLGKHFGGSPDGLSECGTITAEYKCPDNYGTFLKLCMLDTPDDLYKHSKQYFYQCHSHMLLTGAKMCHFVVFDPREKKIPDIKILEIPYDKEIAERIETFVRLAIKEKLRIIKKLTS